MRHFSECEVVSREFESHFSNDSVLSILSHADWSFKCFFGEMCIQITVHFKLDCDIVIGLKKIASYLYTSIR